MSTVADFNRIEDCDKIDSRCIEAFHEFTYDEENAPTTLCDKSSWGGDCINLEPLVKAAESCTTIYLSPEDNPNCLVYEPEEKCGDNVCINGDDLSRIISLQRLKDVDQNAPILGGEIYRYNSTTQKFEPYDVTTVINNLSSAVQNLSASLANILNRLNNIDQKLTPPVDAPNDAKIVFGTVNAYYDPNAVVNEGTGAVTTLDKTHGLYTHTLADDVYGDSIFG